MTTTEPADSIDPVEPTPIKHTPSTTRQRSVLLWVAAIVLILDQLSKQAIEATLPLYQSWAPSEAIAPFFRLTHTSNTGIAFGMLPAGSSFFVWTSAIVSLAIVAYSYGLPAEQSKLRLALSLQLGGALGNLVDRLRLGHVTDFLDFGPWPVFNLADLAIVTGAILLAWFMWREEQQHRAANEDATFNSPDLEGSDINQATGILDEWPAN